MYYRKKWGKGFTYQTANGKTIRDPKLKEWFESLVIPPAWTEVEISKNPKSDLLVSGRDDKNRKQYIYHPDYLTARKQEKFNRIVRFAQQLEHMRRVTGQHLRHESMTREKALACMVRLLDLAYFRPGSPKYTQENETYGLTTMRSRHLDIEGDELTFTYTGKAGQDQERQVIDHKLAQVIRELDDIPGYRIFKYYDDDGEKHTVESADLNAYIKTVMGEDFSAKDFRTWAGTMIAAVALDQLGAYEPHEQDKIDKNIKKAVIMVAEQLGNTPAVARSAYIDPKVIDAYMKGQTMQFFKRQVEKMLKEIQHLSSEELSVLCLLQNA